MRHHSGIYFYDENYSEIRKLSGGDCCHRGESSSNDAAEPPADKDLSGAYKVFKKDVNHVAKSRCF